MNRGQCANVTVQRGVCVMALRRPGGGFDFYQTAEDLMRAKRVRNFLCIKGVNETGFPVSSRSSRLVSPMRSWRGLSRLSRMLEILAREGWGLKRLQCILGSKLMDLNKLLSFEAFRSLLTSGARQNLLRRFASLQFLRIRFALTLIAACIYLTAVFSAASRRSSTPKAKAARPAMRSLFPESGMFFSIN